MTTRIQGREDDDLLSQKGFQGFPSLAIMDANGEVLKKDLGRSIPAMNAAVDSIGAYHGLKARIASGEKGLEGKMFMAELAMGKITAAEAKSKVGALKLSAADSKKVDSLIFDSEFSEWLDKARSRRMPAPEFFGNVHKAFKAGRRPTVGGEAEPMFWQFLLQGAENAADPVAFEAAAKKQLEQMKKQLDTQLEAIKRKAASKKK